MIDSCDYEKECEKKHHCECKDKKTGRCCVDLILAFLIVAIAATVGIIVGTFVGLAILIPVITILVVLVILLIIRIIMLVCDKKCSC